MAADATKTIWGRAVQIIGGGRRRFAADQDTSAAQDGSALRSGWVDENTIGGLFAPPLATNIPRSPISHSPGSTAQAITVGLYYGNVFVLRPGDTFSKVVLNVNAAPTGAGTVKAWVYKRNRVTSQLGALLAVKEFAYDATSWAATNVATGLQLAFDAPIVSDDEPFLWVVLQFSATPPTLVRGTAQHTPFGTLLPYTLGITGVLTATVAGCVSASGTYGNAPGPEGSNVALVPNNGAALFFILK